LKGMERVASFYISRFSQNGRFLYVILTRQEGGGKEKEESPCEGIVQEREEKESDQETLCAERIGQGNQSAHSSTSG